MREPASRRTAPKRAETSPRRAAEPRPEADPAVAEVPGVDCGPIADFVGMPLHPPATQSEPAAAPAAQLAQRRTDAQGARDESANETGIPTPLLRAMEGALGQDFSEVRVHPDSPRAPEVGALAYTQGRDVHVAPGRYEPQTPEGKALLGHELTHVVQQAQGRVRETGRVHGVPVNDDPGLEREADVMGEKVAREAGSGVRQGRMAGGAGPNENAGSRLGSRAPSEVGGKGALDSPSPERKSFARNTSEIDSQLQLGDAVGHDPKIASPFQRSMVPTSAPPIQRKIFDGPDIEVDVTAFAKAPNENKQQYLMRFKAAVHASGRAYKGKNWADNKKKVNEKAGIIHFGEEGAREIVEVRSPAETAEMIPTWQHERHVGEWKNHLDATYAATGYKVSFGGHTENVYDLTGGFWGYVDTAHGEIEVLTEKVTSGTTLGFRDLTLTFVKVTRTVRGVDNTTYELQSVNESALVKKKTHKYNLFT